MCVIYQVLMIIVHNFENLLRLLEIISALVCSRCVATLQRGALPTFSTNPSSLLLHQTIKEDGVDELGDPFKELVVSQRRIFT